MQNLKYNIKDFDYDKESKTFTASLNKLYPIDSNYHIPFPNGRRHFYIKNPKTGEFRRFSFQKELQDENAVYYIFKSQDDLYVHILVIC